MFLVDQAYLRKGIWRHNNQHNDLFATLSINDAKQNDTQHNRIECRYVSDILLNVVILRGIIMDVVMLNVIMLSVNMLSAIMLNVTPHNLQACNSLSDRRHCITLSVAPSFTSKAR